MTSEPEYEYRIVDREGHGYPSHPTHMTFAQTVARAHRLDETKRSLGPHRLQRKLCTAWEDLPDD